MRAWCRWRTAVRSRRLCRLRHLHAAFAWRRCACGRCLPALGAGDGGGCLMEAVQDPYVPHSMVLMGGPIDTRINPTAVNKLAEIAASIWFRKQRHHQGAVPASRLHARRLSGLPAAARLHEHESRPPYRGAPQSVHHLVKGDGDSAQKHREFYDEYLAVMDLCAEYLSADRRDGVRAPCATERRNDPSREPRRSGKIKRVALMTVEGEHDDISGVGQTEAAHRPVVNLPDDLKTHWLQPASATTASSTARGFAPRSRRGSAISSCRMISATPGTTRPGNRRPSRRSPRSRRILLVRNWLWSRLALV